MLKLHEQSQDSAVSCAAKNSLVTHPVVKELAELSHKDDMLMMMSCLDEMQLLQNLATSIGAKKTFIIGVHTGISALSIALVLPKGGKVYALDVSKECADIGIPYWKKAGVDSRIKFVEGPVSESLDKFIARALSGYFDFIFIDADKLNIDKYYERCLVLIKKGGIIAIDNGPVLYKDLNDPSTSAMRALNEKLHHDERVRISSHTIGDGTTILFKK